jgi:hypothetical protein
MISPSAERPRRPRRESLALGLHRIAGMSVKGGERTFAGERCARARTGPGRGSSVIEPHSAAWG